MTQVQKCINFPAKVASNGKYLKRDHVTTLYCGCNPLCIKICMFSRFKCEKITFDLRNKVSQRIIRNGSDVHIDYRRTAVGQKAVSVSGEKLWNTITMNIRNSNIIVTFKSHLCTNTFYRAPITVCEQSQTFLIKIGPSSVLHTICCDKR